MSTLAEAAPAEHREGRIARRVPAWAITAALGAAYLIARPQSPDLAAASYRSFLFSHEGFTLWDNSWYGGHHLPAYSLLSPALGALLGPRLVAAVSMTIATALFARLIEGRFAPRATRLAAVWFAVGASIALLSSRVPFDLGLAIGLGSLLAARRAHDPVRGARPRRVSAWLGAAALALLCAVASPVAGAFLALACVTWALAGRERLAPALLAAVSLAPIALLTAAFPEGGTQPFVASAFYPALAAVVALGLLFGVEQRLLRTGAALYALALLGSYVIPTAVGGNADRLGALAAGPVAACALAGSPLRSLRGRALVLLALPLLYWQANAPVADFAAALGDPAVRSSYYTPLLGELRRLGVGYGARPARIEAVPTVSHWEARHLAPAVMIARGWERQLDRYRNALFYRSHPPTAGEYRAWLAREAIAYVALPDAPLDYSAHGEARLLGRGEVPGVREVWRSRHWRLFAVSSPQPLSDAPSRLTSVGRGSFTLLAPRAGSYTVRVRFTPYWRLASGAGCVQRGSEGWTLLRARDPGTFRVDVAFALDRVLSHGPRCR